MSNIQRTLDLLQPYVIGIRYVEGTPVVDAVFKEGWSVPPDNSIKLVKGDESMNYYMLFSDLTNIGLDGLLAYVDKVIKLNLEREKKHELLRIKVNELKEVFKKNTLVKLTSLKFIFSEEELIGELNNFDIDIDIDSQQSVETFEEEIIEQTIETKPAHYLDEQGNTIELTEDEREILEEEARAERNIKAIRNKQKPTIQTKVPNKVELPPKRKSEMVLNESYDNDTDCECGPDEACNRCMDSK